MDQNQVSPTPRRTVGHGNAPWALRRIGHPTAANPIYRHRVRTPAARPYPFSLAEAVGRLEKAIHDAPDDHRLYASLGELYLFEVNWISRSLEMFERAAQLAPTRLDYQWRALRSVSQ